MTENRAQYQAGCKRFEMPMRAMPVVYVPVGYEAESRKIEAGMVVVVVMTAMVAMVVAMRTSIMIIAPVPGRRSVVVAILPVVIASVVTVIVPVIRLSGFMAVVVVSVVAVFVAPVVIVSVTTVSIPPSVVMPEGVTAFSARGFRCQCRPFIYADIVRPGVCRLSAKQRSGA
jgi:hypothetical protein